LGADLRIHRVQPGASPRGARALVPRMAATAIAWAPTGATVPQDVVFAFAYTSWSGALARELTMPEDRLAAALPSHPRVRGLVVGDPARSAPAKLVRHLRGGRDAAFPDSGGARLHQPLRLRRWDPTSPRAVDRFVASYERGLRQASELAGLDRPAVICAHPVIAGLGDFAWAGPITYFAWDDWSASEPHRRWWPAYQRSFERIAATGRAVCAVSERALERVGPTGPAAVVPNGIDPVEWLEPDPPPEWFTELPGLRLLYVGSLDDRIDTAQVSALADARPDASIVLVGPLLDPGHYEDLRRLPNVRLVERRARREIVALVCAADACLIPHVRNPMTEAMSPLKLYEYLAGGAPIAAADLPGIAGVDPTVELVEPGADMAPAVERALARGRARESVRRRAIQAHSWTGRIDDILELALREGPA
jgi:teichuronic acid biosynthesis glycosyltransferase TuaH